MLEIFRVVQVWNEGTEAKTPQHRESFLKNVINLQLSIYVQPTLLSFSASSCRRLKNVV